jgi:hypothetical protein
MPVAAEIRAEGAQESRSGKWSDAEINLLMQLWTRGMTNRQISERLDRHENAVAVKASRLGLPPKSGQRMNPHSNVKTKSRMRPCLSCRGDFLSEGSHHRICNTCKNSEIFHS